MSIRSSLPIFTLALFAIQSIGPSPRSMAESGLAKPGEPAAADVSPPAELAAGDTIDPQLTRTDCVEEFRKYLLCIATSPTPLTCTLSPDCGNSGELAQLMVDALAERAAGTEPDHESPTDGGAGARATGD